MRVLQGEKLKQIISEILKNKCITRERFLLKNLHEYVSSEDDRKVLCLYGLRRTGKTIMMLQEMNDLNDFDHVLYIRCDENDTMGNLRAEIDAVLDSDPDCRKIFIDEATKAKGFINCSSFLADDYSIRGIRIVLSGTDSLSFLIAGNRELYDRAVFLHTTYIPFAEYHYLLGKSLDDYIRYGGTLTQDGEENAFHDGQSAEQYVNSAIVENILHTLKTWNDGDNVGYDVLADLIEHGLLESAVNKVLEYHNHRFTKKQINDDFKPHDWGSVVQMMPETIAEISLDEAFDTENIKKLLQNALGIKNHRGIRIDDETVSFLVKYLIRLDVLYPVPKTVGLDCEKGQTCLFTQVGMRYAQAVSQAEVLEHQLLRTDLAEKLVTDIRGQILEDIVFGQLLRDCAGRNDRIVTRYRDYEGKEIDILVLDRDIKSIAAIEVKHSDKQDKQQRKHLVNEAVCSQIERITGMKIVSRAVVYRGENGMTEDGVWYINADEFLCSCEQVLQALLPGQDSERNDCDREDAGEKER